MPRRRGIGTTVIAAVVVIVLVIGTIDLVMLTSQTVPPAVSTSLSTSSTLAASTKSETYSSVSASGLRLQIALNASSVETGEPLTAQVSLFNTLATNLSLAANYSANPNIANWDNYDYLCGLSFSVQDTLGFAIFQGNYGSGNLSQAGTPLLLTPPVAESCPNRFYNQAYIQNVEFAPESYLATLSANSSFSNVFKAQSAEMQVNATTGSCITSAYTESGYGSENGVSTTSSGTQLALDCGSNGASSLTGYWTMPINGTYVQINARSNSTTIQGLDDVYDNYFHQFSPGSYTIVAEDMWNQTVFGYFQVTPSSSATSSGTAHLAQCPSAESIDSGFGTLTAGTSSPAIICIQLYYYSSTPLTLNLTDALSIQALQYIYNGSVGTPRSFSGASNFTVTASQAQLTIGGPTNENEGTIVTYAVAANGGASGTYQLGFLTSPGPGGSAWILGSQEPLRCGYYGTLVAGNGQPNYAQPTGCITYSTTYASSSTGTASAPGSITVPGIPYALLGGDVYFRMVGVTSSTG